MSNTIDNLSYDKAHAYYMVYYAGDPSKENYDKGKEVAQSDKWQEYISKWQTEDQTIYTFADEEMSPEAESRINELNQNSADNSHEGGVESGVVAGAVGGAGAAAASGVALGLSVACPAMASAASSEAAIEVAWNGSIAASAVYMAFGAVFLALTVTFQQLAKQNRELQENYSKDAEPDINYDFVAMDEKATEIHDTVAEQNEMIQNIKKDSGDKSNLATAVSNATRVSDQNVSLSAKGENDEVSGAAYDELAELNGGILDSTAEYDGIIAEVDTRRDVVKSIKDEYPKFEKQRKSDRTAMLLFGTGGALAAAAAAIGIALSVINVIPALILASEIMLGIGAGLFGISAVVAFMEASKQKQELENATKSIDTTKQVAEQASSVSGNIHSSQAEANDMYKNGLAIQEAFAEKDSNNNGALV